MKMVIFLCFVSLLTMVVCFTEEVHLRRKFEMKEEDKIMGRMRLVQEIKTTEQSAENKETSKDIVIFHGKKISLSTGRSENEEVKLRPNRNQIIYSELNSYEKLERDQRIKEIAEKAKQEEQSKLSKRKLPISLKFPTNSNEQFYCGSNRADLTSKVIPKDLSERELLTETKYGFSMYVDANDMMVSKLIRESGTWEADYINLIGNIVQKGNSVLNLGSQSGLEALIMGKLVGETGRLFIFEPYSFSNKMVTHNVEINNLTKITTIYKYGASDIKTKATIQVSYSNTGGSEIIDTSSLPNGGSPYSENEIVEIDRVDSLLPNDTVLDFALLDVEKMEIKALKGLQGIIERSPNLIIMTEWQYGRNQRRNETETLEMLNYLESKGYGFYSYSGGNHWSCNVGLFSEYVKKEELLEIEFRDVFLIPKHHPFLQK